MIQPKGLGKRIKLPKLLQQIQDDALFTTNQCLENLFAVCDDLFYDLSNRASSNKEQTLYFDSMREIRIKKQGVISTFQQTLTQSFINLIEKGHKQGSSQSLAPHTLGPGSTDLNEKDSNSIHPRNTEPRNASSLSLVENDDLEIDLAISSMANRTRSLYLSTLYELTLRLDHLFPQIEVTEKNNPLDPEQICHAFSFACKKQFEIGIKPQIIIFKQFERYVLNQLGHCYADANQLLIDTGILPKIPRNLQHQTTEAPSQTGTASQADTEASDQQKQTLDPGHAYSQTRYHFNLAELSSMLSSARTTGPSSNTPYYSTYSTNPGPMMGAAELIHMLTKAQFTVDKAHDTHEPKNYLHPVISQLLNKKHPDQPQSLKQTDDDVINLVAMFFEFILDDENIASAIRAQISRLQIPILKVALKDNNFFNEDSHSARRLIDTIAEIGVSLDENKPLDRDVVYQKVKSITQTVNNQYNFDELIFSTLLAELNQVLLKERRRSALIEKRTSQTETGKSKIKLAKNAARKLLIKKLRHSSLPDEIRDFLIGTWLNALVITYLKFGEESPDWVDARQTVDDLIWACQQHKDNKALKRINALIPDLLARISNGMELVSDHPESQTAKKLLEIEGILYRAEKNDIQQSDYHPISDQQVESILNEEGNKDSSDAEDSANAIEQQKERYKALSYEFIKKAEQTSIGSWFRYDDKASGKTIRCKLATKLEATDAYIFVNRLGFKVLEKQRKEFAYDMQKDRATYLDSSPLFARVISHIANNLRQVINQPPTPPTASQ